MMQIEYKDKAWHILQALNDFGPQRREQLIGDDAHAAECVKNLMAKRFLRRIDDHEIDISATGKSKLKAVNAAMRPSTGEKAGPRTYQGSGTYDGRELGRTCVRPGAYDAYQLPSMFAGKRVERRAA